MEELCFDDVQIVIERHLTSLIQEFNLIIPKNANDLEWVRNPFAIDVDTLPESYQSIVGFQEEFIDIQCDNVLINCFKKHLVTFGRKSSMKRVLLAHTPLKLSCHLLLPACVRVGFLRLLTSKQRREIVFSLKMT